MIERSEFFLSLSVNVSAKRRAGEAGEFGDDDRFGDVDEYLRIARLARAAGIDSLFLADHPVLYRDPGKAPIHTLDPFSILSTVLASVPDIGGIITASTSLYHPFNLARVLQSLNWLTKGRVAWNVVATWNPDVVANYGLAELPDHRQRYARAVEAVELVKALWGSWELGSAGEERGQVLDFQGTHYASRGPLNVPRPAWGDPLIVQAGGSSEGIRLGGVHADLIYAAVLSPSGAASYRRELGAEAASAGRQHGHRILPGLRVVTGSTATEVRDKLPDRDDPEFRRRREAELSGQLSLDLETLDRDRPLQPAELAPGGHRPIGFFKAVVELISERRLSFNELLAIYDGGHLQSSGTPDQIADEIERWAASGTIDGFTLSPFSNDDDLGLLLGEVVPELKRRGVFEEKYDRATLRDRFVAQPPTALPSLIGVRERNGT